MATAKIPKNLVDLKTVVNGVLGSIAQFKKAGAGLPNLTSAEFDLKVTDTVVPGVSVSLWIVQFTLKRTKETVRQYTFKYEKPTQKTLALAATSTPDELVKEIKKAAEQASELMSGTGTDEFPLKTATITIQFGVKWEGSGGINIPISFVTVGPSLVASRNNVHSVKLVFGKATA